MKPDRKLIKMMQNAPKTTTSVLIADDHQLLIDAVGQVLEREPDLSLRAARSLAETMSALEQEPVDLVLLDLKMPGMVGMSSIREVIKAANGAPVALFSGNVDENFARLALREGASGYVPKTISMRVLPAAIRLLCSGEVFMPVNRATSSPASSDDSPLRPLSEQELRILHMVQDGQTNKEIARLIDSTEVRIKMYLRTIFAKLGAKNRAHAVSIMREQGSL